FETGSCSPTASAATSSPTSPSSSTASGSRPRERRADAGVDRARPPQGSRHDPVPAAAGARSSGIPRPDPRHRGGRSSAGCRGSVSDRRDRGRRRSHPRRTSAVHPVRFRFEAAYETAFAASGTRPLARRARPLKRSIHIRHVDAGSDGSEEWEIAALTNPYYDMQRLGLFFTAAPRHADILLVTGAVTQAMEAPLRRAWDVMPEPKAIVAAG